jgi:catechol 2,3-dioxygenase-like lactoylglutathione lyase family enzyme
MLSHLSLGTADLARAIRFYDAVLGALGYVRLWTTGERAAGYGVPGGNDRLALFAAQGPVAPPGPGFHLAFTALHRDAVDRFHAEGLRHGGVDLGEPGFRPHYGPSYYAAFLRDPDGWKLEAVCQQAEQTSG